MAGYQSVFRRYEKKYLLDQEQFSHFYSQIAGDFVPDEYGESTICNIYFDTPDHLLIRRSLEKPAYKEKLRLRSYRIPKEEDTVFVELKKKYKGIVYKRRVPMSYREALSYLYQRESIQTHSQITNEIDWTFAFYERLQPQMFISYKRTALYGKEDPALRMTFDSHILYRDQALFLDQDAPCQKLLPENMYLMELKFSNAMPLWIAHVLDQLEVYPASFSKYGNAYRQMYLDDPQQNAAEKEFSYA